MADPEPLGVPAERWDGPGPAPTPEGCGTLWLGLLEGGEAFTLTALAGHVEAYAVAGCEDVCGPLLAPTALAAPCRPSARR